MTKEENEHYQEYEVENLCSRCHDDGTDGGLLCATCRTELLDEGWE